MVSRDVSRCQVGNGFQLTSFGDKRLWRRRRRWRNNSTSGQGWLYLSLSRLSYLIMTLTIFTFVTFIIIICCALNVEYLMFNFFIHVRLFSVRISVYFDSLPIYLLRHIGCYILRSISLSYSFLLYLRFILTVLFKTIFTLRTTHLSIYLSISYFI